MPDIVVPLTRDNFAGYYDVLMHHALDDIRTQRNGAARPPTWLERVTVPLPQGPSA